MNENIKIIYEDNYIIAVHKPAGLATQTSRLGEKDLFSEIKNYLNGGYVGIINRLDQPVEGIVLMAKDSESASVLTKQIKEGSTDKYYRAKVYLNSLVDITIGKTISLTDYMKKDSSSNLSVICEASDEAAKDARLEYSVVDITNNIAALDIHLLTGRHHQIRLQLSNAGMPILGDTKYGSTESKIYSRNNRIKNVQLCAYKYAFTHPKTHERVELTLPN